MRTPIVIDEQDTHVLAVIPQGWSCRIEKIGYQDATLVCTDSIHLLRVHLQLKPTTRGRSDLAVSYSDQQPADTIKIYKQDGKELEKDKSVVARGMIFLIESREQYELYVA
jgi:hypothetical protein